MGLLDTLFHRSHADKAEVDEAEHQHDPEQAFEPRVEPPQDRPDFEPQVQPPQDQPDFAPQDQQDFAPQDPEPAGRDEGDVTPEGTDQPEMDR